MKPSARSAAFTLLEILSVVAIFALIAGLALPNFSVLQARRLKHQANRIVSQIELARQRAIVTGISHRLFIDVDEGAYRLEWFVSEAKARGEEGDVAAEGTGIDLSGASPLPLAAPRGEERSYRPLPGTFGRLTHLEDGAYFAGIETTGGWVESGESFIRFERDGSADATTIAIENESGLSVILEVLPLADTVRIRYETL